ncbi:glycosyltransferase family 2 protein [Paeniroseomonas aquatica]|uniref:glycosyltransferase family 2 protein n=1 Tax=Paeniroseomonas aquatica TaxID=373043 RepID=UPI00361A5A7A
MALALRLPRRRPISGCSTKPPCWGATAACFGHATPPDPLDRGKPSRSCSGWRPSGRWRGARRLPGPPPTSRPASSSSFQQPGLLAEAIASALGQVGVPPVAVVVVDDGCPFPSGARTALDFAAAHPGRVFLLRRPNGGLSAARNTGIDFVLRAFPACRAVHFLDADNRLHPHVLARALAALDAAPEAVGWVYPDIDEFGGRRDWTTAGGFSLLQLLGTNYCDAGSVVRRRMLDHGLRFDESLRQGFEDWDFWLTAAGRGWRGQHLPMAGFRYRRRPESMLSASERLRPCCSASCTASMRRC